MDLKRALAVNLLRERRNQRLTQEELADRAGVTYRYLGSIEREQVAASIVILGKLADALGVDPCKLIAAPTRRRT